MQNVSSGSPLINSNQKIIGQLIGGCEDIQCDNPSGQVALYGKLSSSWTGAGVNGIGCFGNNCILKPWLDPYNKGITVLDGIMKCPKPSQIVVYNINQNENWAFNNKIINGTVRV